MNMIDSYLEEREDKRILRLVKETGAELVCKLLTKEISESKGVLNLRGNFYDIDISSNYSLIVRIISPSEVRRSTINKDEYYIEAEYTLNLQIIHKKKGILATTVSRHKFLMSEKDKQAPKHGEYKAIHIGYESCFRDEINSLVLNLHNNMYR